MKKIRFPVVATSACLGLLASALALYWACRMPNDSVMTEGAPGQLISRPIILPKSNNVPTLPQVASTAPHSLAVDRSSFRPEYSPLTPAEIQEFAIAEVEIEHFIHWGKISPDRIEAFRATIFFLGERGVAHYARELGNLAAGDVKGRQAAESVIKKIDMISYFATLDRPVAIDAIKELALRSVDWNEDGQLLDGLKATVTFEAFDVLAKLKPEVAVAHILNVAPRHRRAYVVHYVYGRRLAGVAETVISKEVVSQFGQEFENVSEKT